MPRVSIIQEYVPSYRAPFFLDLKTRCAQMGIQVEVYAGEASGQLRSRGDATQSALEYSRVPQKHIEFAGRRATFRVIPKDALNTDLLIIEQARRNLDAYRLLLPRRTWPTPKIAMWGHGRDYVVAQSRIESHLSKVLTRRVDHFFAYTVEGARTVENIGLPGRQVTVVQNSTDTGAFVSQLKSASSSQVQAFRQANNLTDRTLLYVGGLDPSKRLEFLIAAFLQAQAQDPHLRLIIAGDGEQREIVREAARSNDSVRWIGRVDGRQKALAFKSAVALAMPGRVGLIAVESMASGLPILTTNWRHHAPEFEYLEPGHTTLVANDSLSDYANLLASIRNNGDLLKEMRGELLRQSRRFDLPTMVENFADGIQQALGPDAGR